MVLAGKNLMDMNGETMPAALSVYDIPVPRERSQTFPSVDFHMWKARRKLLGDAAGNNSDSPRSNGSSMETISEVESLPAVLCAYDIPLPTCSGYDYYRDEDDVEFTPVDILPRSRFRSVTLPASDLQQFRIHKLIKTQREEQRLEQQRQQQHRRHVGFMFLGVNDFLYVVGCLWSL